MVQGIEQEQVRQLLIPDFLDPLQERPEIDGELAELQRLREAEPQRVRWRRSCHAATDPALTAMTGAMREQAMPSLVEESDLGLLAGSTRHVQFKFLEDANSRLENQPADEFTEGHGRSSA